MPNSLSNYFFIPTKNKCFLTHFLLTKSLHELIMLKMLIRITNFIEGFPYNYRRFKEIIFSINNEGYI